MTDFEFEITQWRHENQMKLAKSERERKIWHEMAEDGRLLVQFQIAMIIIVISALIFK